MVNIDDFLAADVGYLEGLTGWANGDFNGDGTVNAADFAILDAAFADANPDLALPPAPVPEPASLVLIVPTIACALIRRRTAR